MEELFRKFCYYYTIEDNTISQEELQKEAKEEYKTYQKKAQKYAKNLKRKAQKLGYKTDFESFCNMLEDYINKKDKLTDEEKKTYLKVLMSLSQLHEVNLREELERYISYKNTSKQKIEEKEIFKSFCLYHLQEQTNVEDFNKLKALAKENHLDFKELQQKALIFVEEIKVLTEKLGFDTSEESLYKMVNEYLRKKHLMTDNQKASYLKILLYLSEIYNIDLRSLLYNPQKENEKKENIEKELPFSDPLDNQELLSLMLTQRYQEGSFEIENIVLSTDKVIKEHPTDILKLQAALTYNVYCIFLDKFNNYAYEDLNPTYTALMTEEEVAILSTITEETIYQILKEIENHESAHYITKKYKLTTNLYQFIFLSTMETTNLKEKHIGVKEYSLFNNDNAQPTISIYINGPEKERILLLNEYIKKCILNNINYDMSGLCNQNESILYANTKDLSSKLEILNNIAEEHPDWIASFANPVAISSRINQSFYGISSIGLYNVKKTEYQPFTSYINDLSEVAYYRTLAKLVISKIPDENAQEIINNFILLKNVFFTSSKNPLKAKYNEVKFAIIKDIINQYIPSVSNTLSIYMNEENKKATLIEEFKKSLLYIANLVNGVEKKEKNNIVIGKIA